MEYVNLGDVATYINGYAFKPEQRGKKGLPIIRIQDLNGNSHDLGFFDGEYPEQVEINTGDILISWSGSLGVYKWNKGKALLNQHIFKVLFNKVEIDKEYFCYAIRNSLSSMSQQTHGATMKHITKKDFDNISIPYPNLDEQKKIANNLNIVNKLIMFYEKELILFEQMVKARFIEMFKSVNDKVTIGSLCDVTSGYSFKSKDINSSNGIKLLQIGNVFFDNVNWETVNYLPDGYNIKYSKFLLNEGDIVVALTRPIIQSLGNVKACVVRELDVPCLLNQRVGRITPKKNIDANLEFIYECLMMNDFTKYVESCCIGCSQPNISVHDIENYLVPNVSLKQQERFVLFKKQVDKSRFDIKKSITELEREVVYD